MPGRFFRNAPCPPSKRELRRMEGHDIIIIYFGIGDSLTKFYGIGGGLQETTLHS
jgi:hypothetical protein